MSTREIHAVLEDEGRKKVLGLWLEETEGAKFSLKVIAELKNRGVDDILIACVGGLKGSPKRARACSRRRPCRHASCTWSGTRRGWAQAINQVALHFEGRLPV